ncbi:hypothetical protein PC113_g17618 [Phytophthora cactorum]|uniref:Uncharacterized protein n=1 Tax=Phytophthora cactorum TaxID=29920 RepID=A0A8T1B9I4_9STRA|nr:hypothetical protein PC113_g17618 [Phytophthora cactorum]KAG2886484.1 hypothetical protein PC114_g19225 [Phytophthora cactorum]KAG2897598.1 hypothetical protein PC115_g17122 [Phytophthora cactorum]KAG3012076.1 hypothetical protein PC120_g14076 [Phytophthora cactorum]
MKMAIVFVCLYKPARVLSIARHKTLQFSIQPQCIVIAGIGFSEESETLSFLLSYDKTRRLSCCDSGSRQKTSLQDFLSKTLTTQYKIPGLRHLATASTSAAVEAAVDDSKADSDSDDEEPGRSGPEASMVSDDVGHVGTPSRQESGELASVQADLASVRQDIAQVSGRVAEMEVKIDAVADKVAATVTKPVLGSIAFMLMPNNSSSTSSST